MTTQREHDKSEAPDALEARSGWMSDQQRMGPSQTIGAIVNVLAGHEVFSEGSDATNFYKVKSGVVRVCKFLNDGRRQIEAFHIAGEVFGLETSGQYQLSAEAVTDCTIISYRRRSVDHWLDKIARFVSSSCNMR